MGRKLGGRSFDQGWIEIQTEALNANVTFGYIVCQVDGNLASIFFAPPAAATAFVVVRCAFLRERSRHRHGQFPRVAPEIAVVNDVA